MPASFAAALTPMIIRSYSSGSNKLGTSPELRILLMSSKNSSWTIWLSVNKNTEGEMGGGE